MKKYVLVLLVYIPLFVAAHDRIFVPEDFLSEQVQSSQILVAWDIHQVLAQKDWPLFYAESAKALPLFMKAAAYYAVEKVRFLYTGVPGSYHQALAALKTLGKGASGQFYADVFAHYGCNELVDSISRLSNAYYPDSNVEALVIKLDEMGIEQCVASNIGNNFIKNLATSFKERGSKIFEVLTKGVVVGNHDQSDQASDCYRCTPLAKPHHSFFSSLKDAYNQGNEKCIIFIDDSLTNVRAAQEAGIVGIWYQKDNARGPEYLKNDLHELGILL